MDESISMIDGVERNRQHPATFEIPTEAEKAAVMVGDFVKIGFELPNGQGERMWVKVTGNGKGTLANDPVFMPMKHTQLVHFKPENILSIIKGEGNEDQPTNKETPYGNG